MINKQGPTGCANLFTGVFGKQYVLVLIVTSRTKPEILRHVVHLFLCVHRVRTLLNERTVWHVSTERGFQRKLKALSLNCGNLKERQNAMY